MPRRADQLDRHVHEECAGDIVAGGALGADAQFRLAPAHNAHHLVRHRVGHGADVRMCPFEFAEPQANLRRDHAQQAGAKGTKLSASSRTYTGVCAYSSPRLLKIASVRVRL
jgi:hypothetical protein